MADFQVEFSYLLLPALASSCNFVSYKSIYWQVLGLAVSSYKL